MISRYAPKWRDSVEVKKNQEYEIEIESFGNSGEGISHIDGYTLFVSGGLPGERVKVVVTKTKKNYGYARLLEVLTPSSDRVEPVCPVAKRCGGCELQHMNYEAQLRFKVGHVKDCLERIGGVDVPEFEVIGAHGGNPWHYRNKAQFPIGDNRNGDRLIGFYAARSHDIIPCGECAIQQPIINEIKRTVEENIDLTEKIRHLYVRTAYATGQTMVCLVVSKRTKEIDEIISRIKDIKEVTSICVNINNKNTNVILGDRFEAVEGPLYIEDKIGDITFRIGPESFYQVNSYITEKLYEKALEYAGLSGGETVWDLYCGIGTISLFLSKKAKKVVGVEIVEQAIENAKENAKINGIDNAEFICGAAEDVIDKAMSGGEGFIPIPDIIVVDPPRKGCDEKLIAAIGIANPSRIVYVSCDPATLARDIARLGEFGYTLKKACVVDQFWQTRHVETCCLLERVSNRKADSNLKLNAKMVK